MKTRIIILGLLLMVSFTVPIEVFAGDELGKTEITLMVSEEDEDRIEWVCPGDEEPAFMSLLPQSPYAYLYNNKVYVSFEGFAQIVHIRVVDNSTGEVVHQETYAAPSEAVILIEEKGDYTLKIAADGTVWEGWFVY